MRTSRSNATARVVLIAVLLAAGTAHAQSVTDDLVKVVVVSRHGVRTPLPGDKKDPKADKTLWTRRQEGWPTPDDWNPRTWRPERQEGDLTKAGSDLAKLMGGYYRSQYTSLLPRDPCPQNSGVFIRADVDERTKATAAAIAEGLSPSCPVPVHFLMNQKDPKQKDPLFHPASPNMVCALDGEKARDSIVKRLPGGFGALDKQYFTTISAMHDVLKCCKPELCSLFKRGPSCKLTDLPTDVQVDGDTVKMQGAIGIASTAAEIFLLEYDNGNTSVAWDVLNDDKPKMATLLTLHNLQFEYMQRTRYIAGRQGSMLLRAVQAALLGQPFPGTRGGPLPPADAKFIILVGHDTNIANLASLLRIDWRASQDLPDKTAPTGALVFELRERAGTRYVNAYYVAQTVDQARGKTPLNTTPQPNQPFTATLHLCVDPAGGPGCPLSKPKPIPGRPPASSFEDLVNTAVDNQCVK